MVKRRITAILLILSAVFSVSCTADGGKDRMTGTDGKNIYNIFETVCSADEALELAKNTGTVVFERKGCTSGNDVWNSFYSAAESGSPASVLCAYYYTLDRARMSEELYERQKDEYPKLFFCLIEYDGEIFSLKVRDCIANELERQESYKYLLHFTGDAPSTALFTSYDNYVLVDDPSATWEGIMAGWVSSVAGAGYKHFTAYRNCLGWKEE